MKLINKLKQLVKQNLYKIIYRNLKFAIISNNCWGGEIYKFTSQKYNTPFIGLFINAKDYLSLLENLDFYLQQSLTIINTNKYSYPVGKLKDIEIHFLHYQSDQEAQEKWERRISRLRFFREQYPDRVFHKMCDNDGGNKALLTSFHQLPLPNKISFSTKAHSLNSHENITILEQVENTVPGGVQLFFLSLNYFNLYKWIKTGKVIKFNKINNPIKP